MYLVQLHLVDGSEFYYHTWTFLPNNISGLNTNILLVASVSFLLSIFFTEQEAIWCLESRGEYFWRASLMCT